MSLESLALSIRTFELNILGNKHEHLKRSAFSKTLCMRSNWRLSQKQNYIIHEHSAILVGQTVFSGGRSKAQPYKHRWCYTNNTCIIHTTTITTTNTITTLGFCFTDLYIVYCISLFVFFIFWSRVSGVTTLRRPCGIQYWGCVCVCFMLILMSCSFSCKIYEWMYEWIFFGGHHSRSAVSPSISETKPLRIVGVRYFHAGCNIVIQPTLSKEERVIKRNTVAEVQYFIYHTRSTASLQDSLRNTCQPIWVLLQQEMMAVVLVNAETCSSFASSSSQITITSSPT